MKKMEKKTGLQAFAFKCNLYRYAVAYVAALVIRFRISLAIAMVGLYKLNSFDPGA